MKSVKKVKMFDRFGYEQKMKLRKDESEKRTYLGAFLTVVIFAVLITYSSLKYLVM